RSPAGGSVAIIADELGEVILHARPIEGVAGDAVAAHAGPAGVGVASAARCDAVAPDERIAREVVIEADDPPAVGAVTVGAVERVAAAVWIAMAGAACAVRGRAARIVTLNAAQRGVAELECKVGARGVIERRRRAERCGAVALGAARAELLAVGRAVA